jgi:hypothetical protein
MRIPPLIALAVIACIVATLVFAAFILRPVMIANSIRNEMREFHAGPFSAERLRKWAADHAGTIRCDGNRCWSDASVINRPLSALGLAPPAGFIASIETNDGKLSQTSIQIISDPRDGPGRASTQLLVHFTDKGAIESKLGAHGVHVGQEPIGRPPAVVYSVDLSAAPHDIALAYDINVWCLARVGGCTGDQQAPGVWALRKSETRDAAFNIRR